MNWLWTFLSGFRNGAGDELLYIWKFFCTHKNINSDKLAMDGWFWNLRRKLALNSLAIVESTFKISANLSFPMVVMMQHSSERTNTQNPRPN